MILTRKSFQIIQNLKKINSHYQIQHFQQSSTLKFWKKKQPEIENTSENKQEISTSSNNHDQMATESSTTNYLLEKASNTNLAQEIRGVVKSVSKKVIFECVSVYVRTTIGYSGIFSD